MRKKKQTKPPKRRDGDFEKNDREKKTTHKNARRGGIPGRQKQLSQTKSSRRRRGEES